jgi:hypothetical protein
MCSCVTVTLLDDVDDLDCPHCLQPSSSGLLTVVTLPAFEVDQIGATPTNVTLVEYRARRLNVYE